jgi:hypothetical protein
MTDTTQSEQLEKRAPDAPEPDPIADRSMSGALLISSLLLMVTLIWSLYDEVVGQRPWKGYQKDFAAKYGDYLETAKKRQESPKPKSRTLLSINNSTTRTRMLMQLPRQRLIP